MTMTYEQALDVFDHKLRLVMQGRMIESDQLYEAMRVVLVHGREPLAVALRKRDRLTRDLRLLNQVIDGDTPRGT